MTFTERMKQAASKIGDAASDIAAKAGDKAQDLGGKGLNASKEFFEKLGDKAQDLGEKGKLLIEIKQLESKAQKLMTELGIEVYNAFAEQKVANITPETPVIKELFEQIDSIKKEIDKKEAEAKAKSQ